MTQKSSNKQEKVYQKFKKPQIVVTPTEREHKLRVKQARESLIELAIGKFKLKRKSLEGLTLEELEFAAQYGSHHALEKKEYVDDRNFLESDYNVHNGTEIMPSEKFRIYRDMNVANKIGGYRMKKRTLYALSENDPVENKKEQIIKILKELPEEYRLIIDRIIDLDLPKFAQMCLNKYTPTIRKYLLPLVEHRANELDIFFSRKKIADDLMIKRSGFTACKTELLDHGLMQETDNDPRDAIISRAHDFLFLFRNNFSDVEVENKTMSKMQLDIELLYDKYRTYFERLTNNKAAILTLCVIKRYYRKIEDEGLALTLFDEKGESYYRTFQVLSDKLPELLQVELVDDTDYEFEPRSIFEVLDEQIPYIVTVNLMNNSKTYEKLVLGMPGELVRSHLYQCEDNSAWYSTHESTWVYGSARQVRKQPLRIKSMMEVFKEKRIKILKGPKILEDMEELLSIDRDTIAIVDDIRPIVASHISSSYLEMDLADVLRVELASIIDEDHQKLETIKKDVPHEYSILKKHAPVRYKQQLANFKHKFVSDSKRMHDLRGEAESVSQYQFFQLIGNYHPALKPQIKKVLTDLAFHPNIRIGAVLSGAWYHDQDNDGELICNPNWAHPGEVMLDRIILDTFDDKIYAYSDPKNLVQIIEIELR